MSDAPRNDAAMAEILASMRRIVAESEQRGRRFAAGPDDPEVLVLTRAMRIDLPPPDEEELAAEQAAARTEEAVRTLRSEAARIADRPAATPADRSPADETAAMLEGAPDSMLDEAAVADIVRAVLRDEFSGEFGRNLTQQIRSLVQAEVTRALASREQK